MRPASRPIRFGTTWSDRYEATASSRPLSVASPRPYTPERVSILSVTKLRPGQVTITRAATISRSRTEPAQPSSGADAFTSWLLYGDLEGTGRQTRSVVERAY